MSAAARPQLRGLLASSTKKHLFGCIIFSTVSVLTFKHFVNDARIKRFEDFHKYVTQIHAFCFAGSVLHNINLNHM